MNKLKAYRITIERRECIKTLQTKVIINETMDYPDVWENADGLLRSFCLTCGSLGEGVYFEVEWMPDKGRYKGLLFLRPRHRENGQILARHIWRVNAYWAGMFSHGQSEEDYNRMRRVHPEEVTQAIKVMEKFEIPYIPEEEGQVNV